MLDQTEVLVHIEQEHAHLTRVFADIKRTFERVAADGIEANEDALTTSAGDLEHALDEMLRHFEVEEQVFFVQILESFPEMSSAIAELVHNHEVICDHTRWLQEIVGGDRSRLSDQLGEALSRISLVADEVVKHTQAESKTYGEALGRLSLADRREMLRTLKEM